MIEEKIGYRLPGGDKRPVNDLAGRPILRRLGMLTHQTIPGTTAFVCIPVGMALFVQNAEIAKIKTYLDDKTAEVASPKVQPKTRTKKTKGVAIDETNS